VIRGILPARGIFQRHDSPRASWAGSSHHRTEPGLARCQAGQVPISTPQRSQGEPGWPHSRSWGYRPSGLVGLATATVLVLLLLGRL